MAGYNKFCPAKIYRWHVTPLFRFKEMLLERRANNLDSIILVTGFRGCISGDTLVRINRSKDCKIYKIGDYYKKTIGKSINSRLKFNNSTPAFIRAFNGKDIRLHKIKNVFYSGEKKTFTLILKNNNQIRATDDHKFLTDKGWIPLRDLKIGDLIMCDTPRPVAKNRKRIKLRDTHLNVPYHPYKDKSTNQVQVHRLIYEARLNNLEFLEFLDILLNEPIKSKSLKYIDSSKYNIHHKDGCHYNNSIDNLQLLTLEEHYRLHGNTKYAQFSQGVPKYIEVKNIEEYGIEDTYDIECEEPYHNFVANDIVVHNSGKSTFAGKILFQFEDFNPWESIVYTKEQVFKQIRKKNNYVWIDEAVVSAAKGNVMTRANKLLHEIFTISRSNLNITFILLPFIEDFDTKILEFVACWVHMDSRGQGVLMMPTNKGLFGRKNWDIKHMMNIYDEFVKLSKGESRAPYWIYNSFRGYINFKKLTNEQEAIVNEIKELRKMENIDKDVQQEVTVEVKELVNYQKYAYIKLAEMVMKEQIRDMEIFAQQCKELKVEPEIAIKKTDGILRKNNIFKTTKAILKERDRQDSLLRL